MKRLVINTLLLFVLSGLAVAQLARVEGEAKDEAGQPVVGATVEFQNMDSGQKYSLKTDKKGKYTHIAMQPGMYKVSLLKDGAVLFSYNKVPITLSGPNQDGLNPVNFDLAKEKAAAATAAPTTGGTQQPQQGQAQQQQQQQQKLTEEQKKALEEQKKIAEENQKIKGLNEKLVLAKNAEAAGNWTQAVTIMEEATAADGTRDLLWARLGDVHLGAGKAVDKTDQAAAKEHYVKSVEAYKKALAIKPMGAYHNNYGQALARAGKPKEALAEYTTAAQADPPNAAMYFFNAGATLTNESMSERDPVLKEKYIDEANNAFDKAITAKPEYAEAWYQKGLNLFANAKVDPKTNKIAPREGTEEALQKYLEIDPEGQYAASAKGIIESLGGTVQTTYKKGKPKK